MKLALEDKFHSLLSRDSFETVLIGAVSQQVQTNQPITFRTSNGVAITESIQLLRINGKTASNASFDQCSSGISMAAATLPGCDVCSASLSTNCSFQNLYVGSSFRRGSCRRYRVSKAGNQQPVRVAPAEAPAPFHGAPHDNRSGK